MHRNINLNNDQKRKIDKEYKLGVNYSLNTLSRNLLDDKLNDHNSFENFTEFSEELSTFKTRKSKEEK